MADIDVFNGDADGICALQQLRLAQPCQSTLVTGVKRDISLLQQVEGGAGDHITVLDISLDKNREALVRLLAQGARLSYYDHHYAGEIPIHSRLDAHIDPTPDRGTSFLVDRALSGGHRRWAIVGTFGDNFDAMAIKMAKPTGLQESDVAQLRELGILMNYNAYGSALEDLHIHPAELFRRINPYPDPLVFVAEDETMALLRDGYRSDMDKVQALAADLKTETHAIYILPDQAWSYRVSGVFANQLAQGARSRAHAVLTRLRRGGYLVSVRSPLDRPVGADVLCRKFPTGGGRQAAAGINHLTDDQLGRFRREFEASF
ncbi:MAG: acetyltransferase [Chromatiaceae bacterium]|nr:acetyltransferase [Chromatiaceae bacterium]MCP5448770.1 acetyltransferase [Chromatiaceae bacterium]